jgi:hypothetical protein
MSLSVDAICRRLDNRTGSVLAFNGKIVVLNAKESACRQLWKMSGMRDYERFKRQLRFDVKKDGSVSAHVAFDPTMLIAASAAGLALAGGVGASRYFKAKSQGAQSSTVTGSEKPGPKPELKPKPGPTPALKPKPEVVKPPTNPTDWKDTDEGPLGFDSKSRYLLPLMLLSFKMDFDQFIKQAELTSQMDPERHAAIAPLSALSGSMIDGLYVRIDSQSQAAIGAYDGYFANYPEYEMDLDKYVMIFLDGIIDKWCNCQFGREFTRKYSTIEIKSLTFKTKPLHTDQVAAFEKKWAGLPRGHQLLEDWTIDDGEFERISYDAFDYKNNPDKYTPPLHRGGPDPCDQSEFKTGDRPDSRSDNRKILDLVLPPGETNICSRLQHVLKHGQTVVVGVVQSTLGKLFKIKAKQEETYAITGKNIIVSLKCTPNQFKFEPSIKVPSRKGETDYALTLVVFKTEGDRLVTTILVDGSWIYYDGSMKKHVPSNNLEAVDGVPLMLLVQSTNK